MVGDDFVLPGFQDFVGLTPTSLSSSFLCLWALIYYSTSVSGVGYYVGHKDWLVCSWVWLCTAVLRRATTTRQNMKTISSDHFFKKNSRFSALFKENKENICIHKSSSKFLSTKVFWSINKKMVVWLNVHAHTTAEQLEEKTVLVDSITNSIYDCASSLGCFWILRGSKFRLHRLSATIMEHYIVGPADVFVYLHFCRRVECLNLHSGQHQCKASFIWVWWCVILLEKLTPLFTPFGRQLQF